ncbi:hypothetical protein KKH27_11280 [bacterium]|nr:hypothetical protein [bacterium]
MKLLRIFLFLVPFSVLALGPACFVPNLGQWEGEFAFRCQAGRATYFVTHSGLTMKFVAKDEGGRMKTGLHFPPL